LDRRDRGYAKRSTFGGYSHLTIELIQVADIAAERLPEPRHHIHEADGGNRGECEHSAGDRRFLGDVLDGKVPKTSDDRCE